MDIGPRAQQLDSDARAQSNDKLSNKSPRPLSANLLLPVFIPTFSPRQLSRVFFGSHVAKYPTTLAFLASENMFDFSKRIACLIRLFFLLILKLAAFVYRIKNCITGSFLRIKVARSFADDVSFRGSFMNILICIFDGFEIFFRKLNLK